MKRLYEQLIFDHFQEDHMMCFVSGPRQVGKTTTSLKTAREISDKSVYLNWDDKDHREIILQSPATIMKYAGVEEMTESKICIIFDEIHKYEDWKNFLKGLFDSYSHLANFMVTGSSRLDIYKKGGDSLMGRYFSYRMHPLSVAECTDSTIPSSEIRNPSKIDPAQFSALFEFGGFPKPFEKRNKLFQNKWQKLRLQQLLREDIRNEAFVHDLAKLEILAKMLTAQAGNQVIYSSLAQKIRVSVDTISRWIELLRSFYYCFLIRPWSKNITRSLIKEPKVYLWDWSIVTDPGSRAENFIASHLLKAVHFWTDIGFGEYDLHYIRDLNQREVDFVVTRNDEPWFLVEAKKSDQSGINKPLYLFQEMTGAKHAFQVSLEKEFINKSCFEYEKPVIVPASTFLSQLI